MKKLLTILSIIILFSCSKEDDTVNSTILKPYKSVQKRLYEGETPLYIYNSGIILDSLYGKYYEGGLIYYLNTSQGNGLIAHTQDNSSSVNWGGFGDIVGANDSNIGAGKANTSVIISYLSDINSAAGFCDNLVLNNYSDWFLPSKDEMYIMMKRLIGKKNVYFGAISGYWTSTNYDFYKVWIISSDNTSNTMLKYDGLYTYDIRIRATRRF